MNAFTVEYREQKALFEDNPIARYMLGLSRSALRPRNMAFVPLLSPPCRFQLTSSQQEMFLKEYKIRSLLERLVHHYAEKQLPQFSLRRLYDQSTKLDHNYILQNARDTIEWLSIYNARRLSDFRRLPYLVILNPSISECYSSYLHTMSSLITASLDAPTTAHENEKFMETLEDFIEVHADTLPVLSKGFTEVLHLISQEQVTRFLDNHLRERIVMRLIAHQHVQLTKTLSSDEYVRGGKFNGVIRQLNIADVITKNAELVNDICLMKYDQSVPITIDTNMYPPAFWSRQDPHDSPRNKGDPNMFPYIEYHLDYILMEIFKNSFRAHIENGVPDPVQVTILTSESPSYLELRIRDKGKGIPPHVLNHIFDYSFSTYESGEGDSYKTLNVPPGAAGNTVAGMGYGLPLLKNYVEIFNETEGSKIMGLLTMQSYLGWGTDVYLKTVGTE